MIYQNLAEDVPLVNVHSPHRLRCGFHI